MRSRMTSCQLANRRQEGRLRALDQSLEREVAKVRGRLWRESQRLQQELIHILIRTPNTTGYESSNITFRGEKSSSVVRNKEIQAVASGSGTSRPSSPSLDHGGQNMAQRQSRPPADRFGSVASLASGCDSVRRRRALAPKPTGAASAAGSGRAPTAAGRGLRALPCAAVSPQRRPGEVVLKEEGSKSEPEREHVGPENLTPARPLPVLQKLDLSSMQDPADEDTSSFRSALSGSKRRLKERDKSVQPISCHRCVNITYGDDLIKQVMNDSAAVVADSCQINNHRRQCPSEQNEQSQRPQDDKQRYLVHTSEDVKSKDGLSVFERLGERPPRKQGDSDAITGEDCFLIRSNSTSAVIADVQDKETRKKRHEKPNTKYHKSACDDGRYVDKSRPIPFEPNVTKAAQTRGSGRVQPRPSAANKTGQDHLSSFASTDTRELKSFAATTTPSIKFFPGASEPTWPLIPALFTSSGSDLKEAMSGSPLFIHPMVPQLPTALAVARPSDPGPIGQQFLSPDGTPAKATETPACMHSAGLPTSPGTRAASSSGTPGANLRGRRDQARPRRRFNVLPTVEVCGSDVRYFYQGVPGKRKIFKPDSKMLSMLERSSQIGDTLQYFQHRRTKGGHNLLGTHTGLEESRAMQRPAGSDHHYHVEVDEQNQTRDRHETEVLLPARQSPAPSGGRSLQLGNSEDYPKFLTGWRMLKLYRLWGSQDAACTPVWATPQFRHKMRLEAEEHSCLQARRAASGSASRMMNAANSSISFERSFNHIQRGKTAPSGRSREVTDSEDLDLRLLKFKSQRAARMWARTSAAPDPMSGSSPTEHLISTPKTLRWSPDLTLKSAASSEPPVEGSARGASPSVNTLRGQALASAAAFSASYSSGAATATNPGSQKERESPADLGALFREAGRAARAVASLSLAASGARGGKLGGRRSLALRKVQVGRLVHLSVGNVALSATLAKVKPKG